MINNDKYILYKVIYDRNGNYIDERPLDLNKTFKGLQNKWKLCGNVLKGEKPLYRIVKIEEETEA